MVSICYILDSGYIFYWEGGGGAVLIILNKKARYFYSEEKLHETRDKEILVIHFSSAKE